MSYRKPARLGDWSSDAQRAMTDNPSYFVWWYSAKSLGLVAAIGVAAYYAGKDAGRRSA
jgi:hypothetical protein